MKNRNIIALGTAMIAMSWVCAGQTLDPWKIYDKLDPDIHRTGGAVVYRPTTTVKETVICFTNVVEYPLVEETNQTPSAVLASYLKSPGTNAAARAAALEVINSSQVINLHYAGSAPIEDEAKDSAFALSIKASHVVPISCHAADGKTYPQIDLVFSKLFGISEIEKVPPPDQWLEEMRRPLEAGFTLGRVTVIPTPTDRISEKSAAAAQAAIRDFAADLLKLKPGAPQLSSFDGVTTPTGLRYEQGLGKAGKAPEVLRDDWCAISLWTAPISGNPRQQAIPTKQYPRQAIEVCWVVRSADPKLNDRVIAAIDTVLKRLDAVEAELTPP